MLVTYLLNKFLIKRNVGYTIKLCQKYFWVEVKVDGPGEVDGPTEWKWTVQTPKIGRFWVKVGGPKHQKVDGPKNRKWTVQND